MAFLCPTKTCNPCNSCNPQFDSSTLSWQFRGIESPLRFLAVAPAISRSHPSTLASSLSARGVSAERIFLLLARIRFGSAR